MTLSSNWFQSSIVHMTAEVNDGARKYEQLVIKHVDVDMCISLSAGLVACTSVVSDACKSIANHVQIRYK